MLTVGCRSIHEASCAHPTASLLLLSAQRRPHNGGCDAAAAMTPETLVCCPICRVDDEAFDRNSCSNPADDSSMPDIDACADVQQKSTSGADAKSGSSPASSRSRLFTIDAILGGCRQASSDDEMTCDERHGSINSVEHPGDSFDRVSPKNCGNQMNVCKNEKTCSFSSIIATSGPKIEQLNAFALSPRMTSVDDLVTSAYITDGVTRQYHVDQLVKQSAQSLMINTGATGDRLGEAPSTTGMRTSADVRNAIQSPWKRQQQPPPQQQRPMVSHGSSGHHGVSHHRGKRIRTIFTADQLHRLEAQFERQQYMVGTERYYLAASLRLTEAQVKVWFQNRRIKWRKQSIERQQAKMAVVSYNRLIDAEDDEFEDIDDSCSDFNDVTGSGSHEMSSRQSFEKTDIASKSHEMDWRDIDASNVQRVHHSLEL